MTFLNPNSIVRKYLHCHPYTLIKAINFHTKCGPTYQQEKERFEWEKRLSGGIGIAGHPLVTCRRMLRNYLEKIDPMADHLTWCYKISRRI